MIAEIWPKAKDPDSMDVKSLEVAITEGGSCGSLFDDAAVCVYSFPFFDTVVVRRPSRRM